MKRRSNYNHSAAESRHSLRVKRQKEYEERNESPDVDGPAFFIGAAIIFAGLSCVIAIAIKSIGQIFK